MASHGKNNNKNILFKEGSNPLFPKSNKFPNPLNYYSAVKLNVKLNLKNNNKKLSSNYINTNINNKKIKENSAVKNYKEINKTYSSASREKEENPIVKLNNIKLSKINPLNFSPIINDSEIIEKYKNNNSHKRSYLSATKEKNKTNINLESNSLRNYKNNLNIISPNCRNSKMINFNNNTYSLRKTNDNKNIIEINNSNNNSYFSNIIINNNSSGNIKSNSKLSNQKNSSNYNYLKTEKNDRDIGTPKDSDLKLIFNNKNIFGKKFDDPPIILKKKDSSSLPLANTKLGNNLKFSNDKNIFNGEYKLHLKRSKKNISNENNIINMNFNNYINAKDDEELILEKRNQKKKNKIDGPEDLHFYYIQVIQEGKKNESRFEKD